MPAACVTDSFDRADSATTLGNADTGETWVAYATTGDPTPPTLGITSNQGYFVTSAVGGKALIDPGIPDVDVQVTVATIGSDVSLGLAVRHHATDDRCYTVSMNESIGRLAITEVNAIGGGTVLTEEFSIPWADGDVLRVRTQGNALSAYVNGVLTATATMDSSYAAFTRVGLYQDQYNGARFDDFSACPLVTTAFVPPLQVGHHGTHNPPGIAGPPLRAGPAAGGQFSPQVQRGHRY